jgi:hypothetical protein
MTELHLLCREYHFKGEFDMGRWLPVGKVILRLRVSDSEWAYEKEIVMDKINDTLTQIASLGIKYELLKVFRLPHQTISIQDVYENVEKLKNT